jgi:hypothetical protein
MFLLASLILLINIYLTILALFNATYTAPQITINEEDLVREFIGKKRKRDLNDGEKREDHHKEPTFYENF